MNKKYAIFDFDGTLVNSTEMWNRLAFDFLMEKGIEFDFKELSKEIEQLTLSEASEYLAMHFPIPMNANEIQSAFEQNLYKHYKSDIDLKRGIQKLLHQLKNNGVKICIASANSEKMIRLCLERLNIIEYFDFILSCEDDGSSKRNANIYLKAASLFGVNPSDIVVYENDINAIKIAVNSGFYCVGVYDNQSSETWNEICILADENIRE